MRNMTEHISPVATQHCRLSYALVVGKAVVMGFIWSFAAAAAQPCPPGVDTDGGTVVTPEESCPGSPGGASETRNYHDPVSGVTLLGGRRTVYVSSSSELSSAVSGAECGQTIQLAPGSYGGNFNLNSSCPANNPVIVRGASGFASQVNGTFELQGARNILTGVFLSGDDAGVRLAGTNNKFIGNMITGWGSTIECVKNAITAQGNSSQAEVSYNEIYRPGAWGNSCSNTQLRIGLRTSDNTESDFHYGAWVHHNYFHDFPQKPNPNVYSSGQDDAIEVGETQNGSMPLVNSGWYIEHNRVENHLQGHGTVDLKVGGVVYRYNTFMSTPGRVDSRGSTLYGSIIESNYHRGSGGSVIHGKDHKIVCNDFNSTIVLKAGNVACDAVDPGHNKHAHACNVLVSGNSAPLNIGKVDASDEKMAATNTTVRAHRGEITLALERGLVDQRGMGSSYQCTDARETTKSMVGPDALESATTGYKAARGL